MEIIICLLIGYLLGTLNPAALFSKLKKVNLREAGTKNLGASNALLVLGRGYGVIVMVFDIFKAFFAAKIAKWLFPQLAIAALLAGLGAVIGHIFPFYLHFQGGKGLAAFGGMVCAYNPWLLLFYLTGGVVLMILANRSVFLPMFAAVTFPIVVLVQTGDLGQFLVCAAAAALIVIKHWGNIGKVERGEEKPLRELIQTKVLKRK